MWVAVSTVVVQSRKLHLKETVAQFTSFPLEMVHSCFENLNTHFITQFDTDILKIIEGKTFYWEILLMWWRGLNGTPSLPSFATNLPLGFCSIKYYMNEHKITWLSQLQASCGVTFTLDPRVCSMRGHQHFVAEIQQRCGEILGSYHSSFASIETKGALKETWEIRLIFRDELDM